ncbi:MAG: L-threonylcarbamoyladenylate synthase [Actinobacteria bacterium]|nr:L-threonylcarbamoyladenylate synthase [Actinomycetota bacterium]
MTNEAATTSSEIDQAVAVLRAGGLVAFPTETVYGLGADASNDVAVARVFSVKGRPTDHPLIVHLADAEQLDDWAAEVTPTARLLADAFWPGPLTLLVERSSSVSLAVTGGRSTVGLRVPDHTVALELLRAFGGGIAAPSANRFGRVSPTTAAHVVADLGDDVDLVLDGGACRVGVESTIVDLTREVPVVLRTGGISLDRLEEVLGHVVEVHVSAEPSKGGARAPGMLEAHYAPEARIVLSSEHDVIDAVNDALASSTGRVGLLAATVLIGLPEDVVELEPAGTADDYAAVLYSRLRQADRLGLSVLVCVPPPNVGLGLAVNDRLRRAAASSR